MLNTAQLSSFSPGRGFCFLSAKLPGAKGHVSSFTPGILEESLALLELAATTPPQLSVLMLGSFGIRYFPAPASNCLVSFPIFFVSALAPCSATFSARSIAALSAPAGIRERVNWMALASAFLTPSAATFSARFAAASLLSPPAVPPTASTALRCSSFLTLACKRCTSLASGAAAAEEEEERGRRESIHTRRRRRSVEERRREEGEKERAEEEETPRARGEEGRAEQHSADIKWINARFWYTLYGACGRRCLIPRRARRGV
mmetsp:Transcript_16705/g.40311  ORF Transcript_16705/g.40311 Transcript_16705/m.40311 type:complete len:261 (+) Transcript_16705:1082-1864(+)